jgi:hypothetical protein
LLNFSESLMHLEQPLSLFLSISVSNECQNTNKTGAQGRDCASRFDAITYTFELVCVCVCVCVCFFLGGLPCSSRSDLLTLMLWTTVGL